MNNDEALQQDKKQTARIKYILAAALLILIIIAALVFIWFTQEQPKPEPASEKIIREAAAKILNKDPNDLTDEDFAKITNISISGWLSDIKMLEKFTNLSVLDLSFFIYPENNTPKWMKFLAKYGIYDLKERFAIDLSPLKKLSHIQVLTLVDICVKNLKPLADLTELKELLLLQTNVSDIEPLKGLKNLQELGISNTQIFNLEPLSELTELQRLGVSNSPVSDLEPLKRLVNLQVLYYSNCPNLTNKQLEELQKALPNLKISRQ